MKKKTALTLSTIALLSAGIAFGGIKLKQRKDFEKTLKTVLIPNAEKELDSLLQKNVSLKDSILQYEHALTILNKQKDNSGETKDPDVFITGPFSGIYDLTKTLYLQWQKSLYYTLEDQLGNYENYEHGDWAERYDKATPQDTKTKELFKKVYYLTGNKAKYFPTVPVQNGKFILKKTISMPDIKYIDAKVFHHDYEKIDTTTIYEDIKTIKTDDIEDFFAVVLDATTSTAETTYEKRFFNRTGILPKNPHPGLKLSVLKSLESFIDALDDSQNVFDTKTLKSLNTKVKKLIPSIEKEYKLAKKADKFKSVKEELGVKILRQKEKITHLKTTKITQLMHEQRKK